MKNTLKKIIYKILTRSLIKANIERKELELKNTLANIIPDISDQYTTFKIDMNSPYMVHSIRGQHAFQISMALKAVEFLKSRDKILNIVDIGDSSGTHLIYLNSLFKNMNIATKTLSVNLDPVAVDKIKSKGLDAICARAEDLHLKEFNISTDLFLLYEVLEHFFNPIDFLHNMATKSECKYFVITIPYVKQSRIGMHHLRRDVMEDTFAENTHIFELSPEDWDLVFKFSGWEVVYRDKYTQYPKSLPYNLTRHIWQKIDFNGFYGVILKKNLKYSQQYKDW